MYHQYRYHFVLLFTVQALNTKHKSMSYECLNGITDIISTKNISVTLTVTISCLIVKINGQTLAIDIVFFTTSVIGFLRYCMYPYR